MLMVELPEVSVGQHGEYDDLSFYPLEKMQNNFYRIQRFRANPTRTLVGVVQDVDFLGIVPIIPDWQLNEFDDLETEEKLSIQLVSDDGLGCQLIDYCFDSWKNLNKLEESEQAIIAESIYSSGKCYYLKQSLKTDGIVNETSVKLTSQAQGNTETSSPTTLVPVAVAISPNGEQTGLHFVWVLCLSTKTTAENGATNESPSFGKYSVCTLTVRGWKCVSQDGEYKLEEMKITGNSHTMKLDLSLGSLVQVGLDSRMVTVGSSCPQGLGSTPVRLVACLGGVGKSFILNLTKTGEESNIWGLQAVELDLPGGTEGNNSGYSNYKLKPTSVFSPARSETGLSYKDIENTEMDQERTFEKLDYRVGLYNQQIAHDLQLVFKARRE